MQTGRAQLNYTVNGEKKQIEFNISDKDRKTDPPVKEEIKAARNGDFYLRLTMPALEEAVLENFRLELSLEIKDTDRIFLNGFQSWTTSREFNTGEAIKPMSRLMRFFSYRFGDETIYDFNTDPGSLHGFSYSYIRREEKIMLFASLNEASGYTIFHFDPVENRLIIHKDLEGAHPLDTTELLNILIASGSDERVFDAWFKQLKITPPNAAPVTGFTSWYNYYTGIDDQIILENLKAFENRKVPAGIFQIDDGWQGAVGDWLTLNHKFRGGMPALVDKIHEAGHRAGLWLAPFVAQKKSEIYRNHPDWFITDRKGRPLKAGYNPLWGGTFYALNIYNDDVQNYLKEVFDLVLKDWNFDMVKLDFLYAAGMVPFEGRTRGQVMSEAMKLLRKLVGKKEILGCGVPLLPAAGQVEYCRIGADVDLKWKNSLLKKLNFRERVSTISSLQSTIGRHHLNGRAFLNDPDVFILRDYKKSGSEKLIALSPLERHTLQLLNTLFGSLVFTSDNLSELTQEQADQFMSIYPKIESESLSVLDEDGLYTIRVKTATAQYVIIANFTDEPVTRPLATGLYYSGREHDFIEDEIELEPHETVCLLKIPSKGPAIAGSDLHILPGAEVDSVTFGGSSIRVRTSDECRLKGTQVILLPEGSRRFKVNGAPAEVFEKNGYRFARLEVKEPPAFSQKTRRRNGSPGSTGVRNKSGSTAPRRRPTAAADKERFRESGRRKRSERKSTERPKKK